VKLLLGAEKTMKGVHKVGVLRPEYLRAVVLWTISLVRFPLVSVRARLQEKVKKAPALLVGRLALPRVVLVRALRAVRR
jgi:hypothetical protein